MPIFCRRREKKKHAIITFINTKKSPSNLRLHLSKKKRERATFLSLVESNVRHFHSPQHIFYSVITKRTGKEESFRMKGKEEKRKPKNFAHHQSNFSHSPPSLPSRELATNAAGWLLLLVPENTKKKCFVKWLSSMRCLIFVWCSVLQFFTASAYSYCHCCSPEKKKFFSFFLFF